MLRFEMCLHIVHISFAFLASNHNAWTFCETMIGCYVSRNSYSFEVCEARVLSRFFASMWTTIPQIGVAAAADSDFRSQYLCQCAKQAFKGEKPYETILLLTVNLIHK